MRAFVVAAFALMLASSAYAGDYFEDVAYDWTGVYGGVHAGFIQANVNVDAHTRRLIEGEPTTDRLTVSYERDVDGFVGGALGGVNFQAGNFVFGLDMDFGGVAAGDGDGTAHAKGTVGGEVIEEDIHFQHGMDWNAHVRGRLGFAMDRVFVYGAGGLAIADFDVKSNRGLQSDQDIDDGGHATGWSAGGGLEYAITENLLIRAEYLHDDFTEEGGICRTVANDCLDNVKIEFTNNIFRVGVSWKFMGGMAFDGETSSSAGLTSSSAGLISSSAGLTLGTAATGSAIPKSVAQGPQPSIAPQTLRSTTGLIQNQQNQQMLDGSQDQSSSIQSDPESPGPGDRPGEDTGSGQLSYPAAIERQSAQTND
jgi:outer membrane immunogenic protein